MKELEEYLNERIKFLLEIRKDNEVKLLNPDDKMIKQWREDAISIRSKIEECRITLHVITKPNVALDVKAMVTKCLCISTGD